MFSFSTFKKPLHSLPKLLYPYIDMPFSSSKE
jgi:hypothetical protein